MHEKGSRPASVRATKYVFVDGNRIERESTEHATNKLENGAAVEGLGHDRLQQKAP